MDLQNVFVPVQPGFQRETLWGGGWQVEKKNKKQTNKRASK